LNGVLGLLLGWVAFPSILVGLTLQAVLFQFGGFTTLGVNTFNMAFPALVCAFLFSPLVRTRSNVLAWLGGAACGALAIFLGAVLIGVSLVSTGESFLEVAELTIVAHIPIMIIEGILTAFCVIFLRKVKPELLMSNEQ